MQSTHRNSLPSLLFSLSLSPDRLCAADSSAARLRAEIVREARDDDTDLMDEAGIDSSRAAETTARVCFIAPGEITRDR